MNKETHAQMKQMDGLVLKVVEHIQKVGKMLREQGVRDALEVKMSYPADFFLSLACKVFHNIPADETMKEIAALWQSDYMDGYEEGGDRR